MSHRLKYEDVNVNIKNIKSIIAYNLKDDIALSSFIKTIDKVILNRYNSIKNNKKNNKLNNKEKTTKPIENKPKNVKKKKNDKIVNNKKIENSSNKETKSPKINNIKKKQKTKRQTKNKKQNDKKNKIHPPDENDESIEPKQELDLNLLGHNNIENKNDEQDDELIDSYDDENIIDFEEYCKFKEKKDVIKINDMIKNVDEDLEPNQDSNSDIEYEYDSNEYNYNSEDI